MLKFMWRNRAKRRSAPCRRGSASAPGDQVPLSATRAPGDPPGARQLFRDHYDEHNLGQLRCASDRRQPDIAPGVTLTIQSGTLVKFDFASLYVEGTLQANGSAFAARSVHLESGKSPGRRLGPDRGRIRAAAPAWTTSRCSTAVTTAGRSWSTALPRRVRPPPP